MNDCSFYSSRASVTADEMVTESEKDDRDNGTAVAFPNNYRRCTQSAP